MQWGYASDWHNNEGGVRPELADLSEADKWAQNQHGTSRTERPLDTVLQFLTPSARARGGIAAK